MSLGYICTIELCIWYTITVKIQIINAHVALSFQDVSNYWRLNQLKVIILSKFTHFFSYFHFRTIDTLNDTNDDNALHNLFLTDLFYDMEELTREISRDPERTWNWRNWLVRSVIWLRWCFNNWRRINSSTVARFSSDNLIFYYFTETINNSV